MEADFIATALHTLIALIGVWVVTFYGWRSCRFERFIDTLFQLRYELFSIAENNPYLFHHPAYRLLREQLNIRIANAYGYSPLRLLVPSGPPRDPRVRWVKHLESIPDAHIKIAITSIEAKMTERTIWYVLTSPMMFIVALVSVAQLVFGTHKRNLRRLKAAIDRSFSAPPTPGKARPLCA